VLTKRDILTESNHNWRRYSRSYSDDSRKMFRKMPMGRKPQSSANRSVMELSLMGGSSASFFPLGALATVRELSLPSNARKVRKKGFGLYPLSAAIVCRQGLCDSALIFVATRCKSECISHMVDGFGTFVRPGKLSTNRRARA